MICVKWKAIALTVAVAVIVCVAGTEVACAVTVSSNVSWEKTVTNGGGYWYPLDGSWAVRAVNGIGKGSTSSSQVLYSYQSYSGLSFDLGREFDLDSVEVWPKGVEWDRLEYMMVRGYEADEVDPSVPGALVGEFQIPDQTAEASYKESVSLWTGVRHLWMRYEGDYYTVDPQLTEFEVWGQVEAYGNGFVTTVTATSPHSYVHPSTGEIFDPNKVCNGAGMLDSNGLATDPADYLGNPNALSKNTNPFQWHMNADTVDGYITFDLGGSYDLANMLIWNHNQTTVNGRGFKDVTIAYSTDGATFFDLADDNGGGVPGNYTIPLAPTADTGYQLDVDLDGLEATHFRITEHNIYNELTDIYPGLSEVRFYGEGEVPDVPGDTDNDQDVDEDDLQKVAENWGSSTTNGASDGDFDGDEVVGPKDAAILAGNWHYGVSEAGAPVPEPSTVVVLITLALGGLLLRRGR